MPPSSSVCREWRPTHLLMVSLARPRLPGWLSPALLRAPARAGVQRRWAMLGDSDADKTCAGNCIVHSRFRNPRNADSHGRAGQV